MKLSKSVQFKGSVDTVQQLRSLTPRGPGSVPITHIWLTTGCNFSLRGFVEQIIKTQRKKPEKQSSQATGEVLPLPTKAGLPQTKQTMQLEPLSPPDLYSSLIYTTDAADE